MHIHLAGGQRKALDQTVKQREAGFTALNPSVSRPFVVGENAYRSKYHVYNRNRLLSRFPRFLDLLRSKMMAPCTPRNSLTFSPTLFSFLFLICFMLPVIQAPEPVIPAHYDLLLEVLSEPGGTGTDPNSNAPDYDTVPDPGPSYPGNSQPAPKPQDTAASAAGVSSDSNQTPFSEEGSDEFLEKVHDFLDSVSSFIDALRSPTTTSTTWNTDTTVWAGESSSPTTTIDHASACSIYSTLSLACASASPSVWSLPTSSYSASPISIAFNPSLTKRSTFNSSTASSTSTPESSLAQASCACYSSPYHVPEMWNNVASACAAGSGFLVDQAAGQTELCKTNVRGWTSTHFDKVSRTSSAVPSTTGGVGNLNGGKGRILVEVAIAAVVVAAGS